jgi:hypothetical protein
MADKLTRSELAAVIILRVIGIGALFATAALLLPMDWMDAIHRFLGLGPMPRGPIVEYLARSLTAFYAALGSIVLLVSLDLQRYRPLAVWLAVLFCLMGCALVAIDWSAGLPAGWTATEGPPTIAVGALLLWLLRKRS